MKYKLSCNAPKTKEELLDRAYALTGVKISDFCDLFNRFFSKNFINSKGYIGRILEIYLGASGGNLPIPDFPNLNIELKTIPLSKRMRPKGNLKICSTSMLPSINNYDWDSSIVKLKLKKVLWIPLESDSEIPFKNRRICRPFLSKLKKFEHDILKQDYENITELLFLGRFNYISNHVGKYLLLKSVSSNKKLTKYLNYRGELIKTSFKGFYIKSTFIKNLMHENLHI